MSTHILCFGPKNKIFIPLHTPGLLYIKVGFKGVFLHGYVFLMSCLSLQLNKDAVQFCFLIYQNQVSKHVGGEQLQT